MLLLFQKSSVGTVCAGVSSSLTDSQDWQIQRSLVDCNRYMLEHQVASDVTFLVGHTEGDRQEICAHKFMLIARSPVFFAMFCGDLAENSSHPITVPDVEPSAFQQMLRLAYTFLTYNFLTVVIH